MKQLQRALCMAMSIALIALVMPVTSGVSAQESDLVVPAMPVITQTTCSADGQQIPPNLTLPQNTDSISYSIQAGSVGAGQQVDVLATLRGNGAWDRDPDSWVGGWFADSDTTALLIISFDDPDCDVSPSPTAPVPTTTPDSATPTAVTTPTTPITGLPTVGSGERDATSTAMLTVLTVAVASVLVVGAIRFRDARSGG